MTSAVPAVVDLEDLEDLAGRANGTLAGAPAQEVIRWAVWARRGSQQGEWDPRRKMIKVNPVVDWSQDRVDTYLAAHRVLVNPLLTQGYPSIGCAPCTRPARSGEDPRSGPWAGTGKTECGLHTR